MCIRDSFSMARNSGGHTNFAQNMKNATKTMACAMSVRLKFMLLSLSGGLSDLRQQRVGEREEHREADADDERGVDQAQQQEHLRLQLRDQLRLAGGALEEARAHDADAD